ncbi:hypothetical protein BDP27DRAFT_526750 [Rhodocollybia butyracea]|uniref:Uncharacterized protein n=1 Tax=Rhodocollybia butyracea TaxID=206335 RepID=A0A9P5U9W1_9AGAR|nr:hypothetical protein BDP27DRAFT_526750 [Rhodocollybia butyracea]
MTSDVNEPLQGGKILSNSVDRRLLQAIESRLLAVSAFVSETPSDEKDTNVLEEIQVELESIASLESELSSSRATIADLITRIDKSHTRLKANLLEGLSTFPPVLNRKRKASDDLVAATIEASLVKLSLLRAQSYQKLYGFTSDTEPDATMAKALTTAHGKLKEEAHGLLEEEHALDAQIEEYERLTRLVDGDSGTEFAQVVEDYIRVEKESEECRRDLRRLGSTGN